MDQPTEGNMQAEWNRQAWKTLQGRLAKSWYWAWQMMAEYGDPERDLAELRAALAGSPREDVHTRQEIEREIRVLELFLDVRAELIAEQRSRFQAVVDECDRLIAEQEQGAH